MNKDTKAGLMFAGILVGFILSLITIITLANCIPKYLSAQHQSMIYNQLHNTSYTTWDFFWASDQINQSTSTLNIQPVERQR